METKRVLSYHFAHLGSLETTLAGDSAKLHDFLLKTNEFERLNHLDHLGIIRFAYPSAHHSRWEYVMLMLYMIDRLREARESHLESARPDEPVDTTYNLLKCWAMLLNLGHLEWTFTAERALLMILTKMEDQEKTALVELLGDHRREWLSRILEGRVYEAHKVLAYLRLCHLNDEKRLGFKDSVERWWKMLDLYNFDQEQHSHRYGRLKEIFRRIRLVAFLGLDSLYTPTPVNLNLSQILTDRQQLARYILPIGLQEQEELNILSSLIYDTIYSSRKTFAAIAARQRDLHRRISCKLQELRYDQALAPLERLMRLIDLLATGEIQKDIMATEYEPVVRFVQVSGISGLGDPFAEQLKQNEEPKTDPTEPELVLWSHPNGRDRYYQLHALTHNRPARCKALHVAFRELSHYYRKIRQQLGAECTDGVIPAGRLRSMQQDLIAASALELLSPVLGMIFSKVGWWEWRRESGSLHAVAAEAADAMQLLECEMTNKPRSRRAELLATMEQLSQLRKDEFVIVAMQQLLAYPLTDSSDSRPLAEFDGILLHKPGEELELQVIEAKSMANSGAVARDQLSARLTQMGASQMHVLRPEKKLDQISYAVMSLPVCDSPRKSGDAAPWPPMKAKTGVTTLSNEKTNHAGHEALTDKPFQGLAKLRRE